MKCRSLWHRPAAAVRTRTSRRFGLAIATSSIVIGWRGAWRTAAFIASAGERLHPGRDRQPGRRRADRNGEQLVGEEQRTADEIDRMWPSARAPVVDDGGDDDEVDGEAG